MSESAETDNRRRRQSKLRLHLFDNPIIRLDFLRFRRRLANQFIKHGWLTLFLYVIVPVSISFSISRWLFPPPYDKWSFVIMLKTMGTLTLTVWGAILAIAYLIDLTIFLINPLGLNARDPLITDPPLVDEYEKTLFVARAIKGIKLFPFVLFACYYFLLVNQYYISGDATLIELIFACISLLIAVIIGTMHLHAVLNLVCLYMNSTILRLTGTFGTLCLFVAPFLVDNRLSGNTIALPRFIAGSSIISSLAWSLHPLGSFAAFYKPFYYYHNEWGVMVFPFRQTEYLLLTIILQTLLVYFSLRLVRIRFRKKILENYLEKAQRG